jgi:pyruvate,water dikinase
VADPRLTGGLARSASPSTTAAVQLAGTARSELLGGKGAALDRLIAGGLPVPPTAVVTTTAYRRFARQPAVADLVTHIREGGDAGADEVDRVFTSASFGAADLARILSLAGEVGAGRRLAVRSSATVEDLSQSSFAGQYRSLLDVDPSDADDLESAVKAVFASLWHPAPHAYRRAFGIADTNVAMGVVLMQMVPAEQAGVVFTVDPGDAAAARIEWVEGLGESLVSGRRTPAAASVPRGEHWPGLAPHLAEALRLALRIEQQAACPQDVEWAWDGDRVWVVQARPITATSAAPGDGFDDDPETLATLDLTTAAIGETLPGVLPPLRWALGSHLVEEAFRRLLDELGVLPTDLADHTLVRRVRGRAAMDFSRLERMAALLPGAADEHLEAEYFGSRRRGRSAAPLSRGGGRLRSMAHDLRVLRVRRRSDADAAIVVQATGRVMASPPDLVLLSDRDLAAYHLRLLDLATRTTAAQLGAAADATATFRRLQVLLGRRLGAAEGGRLADRVVTRAGVTIAPDSRASAAAFSGPTWAELGRTPPAPGRRGGPEDEAAALDELATALGATPGAGDSLLSHLRQRQARHLAHDATTRLALRERTKAALLLLGGEVRRVHLEAGRRLVAAGALAEVQDVELLSPAELFAPAGAQPTVPAETVARRRRWRATYEQDGPLPPRFSGVPEAVEVGAAAGDRLEGWATSGGRFRGVVQVVHSPDEDLAPGAVLVAEATDPSWSPLFMLAGAVVLDRGGPLSHAAILARELEVPAVLNVAGATSLRDGQDVTVDGDAGIVVVHHDAEMSEGTP